MRNLRKQLPPLASLVVFEAAARHLSFTRAAQELNITQAAVSRQIRTLESNLGVALFTRLHRNIALTDQGKTLVRTVAISLQYLADTVAELRAPETRSHITVVTTHAFASLWLIPRLENFRDAFPEINVRLLATDQEMEQFNEAYDVCIRYGSGHWTNCNIHHLGPSEIFPVCSPDYLAKHRFTHLEQLLEHTLLCQDDLRWDWVDWPLWLAELGLKHRSPKNSLKMNSYPLLIQAATAGQGIALGWRYLVDDLLTDGSLVRPLDICLPTRHSFYVLTLDQSPVLTQAEIFCEWVVSEFKRSDSNRCAHDNFRQPGR